MKSGKNIDACIRNYVDVLVKAESCKSVKMHKEVIDASKFIAFVVGYDYTKLNAADVISAFSSNCGSSVGEFRDCLHTYIENQEQLLWRSLSMDKVPSEEELIEHILVANLEEIIACAERYVNKPPKNFTTMLLHPVIDTWNKKWENECAFCAKLYDIHNRVVEISAYASRDYIMESVQSKIEENPGRYSRYVMFIKTPFHDAFVVYTIEGGVGAEYICRSSAQEWKAVFYDYMDHEVASFTSDEYLDKKYLMRNMCENNALYCVLCCRNAPEEDFTVQYFKSNRYFYSQDAVTAMEENIINHYSFELPNAVDEFCPEEWKAVLYDAQDRAVMTYMSHTKMLEKHLYSNMIANGCKYYVLYHRNGPHEEFTRC